LRFSMRFRSIADVGIRRSHFRFLAALLAFTALFGINALSTMHMVIPHDDGHPHLLMEAEHHHNGENRRDPTSTAHQAMHMAASGISLPDEHHSEAVALATTQGWAASVVHSITGLDPALPLRPPQA